MKTTQYKILTLAVLTALLSACGGGGGGSGSDIRPDYNGGGNNNNNAGNTGNTSRPVSSSWQSAAANDKAEALSGDGAYVGIVDSGVNPDGAGLRHRNSRISKKVIDVDTNNLVDSTDAHGHGTKMSEIILDTAPLAAINSGVNSPSSVYSSTGLVNLLLAMEQGTKIDVLNNSYGDNVSSNNITTEYGKDYERLKDSYLLPLYREFVNRDVLVLKAVGNEDKDIVNVGAALPLVAPELEKGFLAVTAYDQERGEKTQNACGDLTKNWCITAPEVFSTYGTGSEKTTFAGTSNATAYVSALAARIKSRYDWFSNEDIKNALITTATDKGAPGVDGVWGHGLVNAAASLNGYGRFDKTHTFNVEGNKRAYFFDNNISGAGGMIKLGRDTLVMNGNNSYTGNTEIRAGELVANGHSVSNHIVASGAKLTIGDSSDTIRLGSVSNQGTLEVNQANLQINGSLNNQNGNIDQAIGTHINISGSADLANSSLTLTGVKSGYVTRQGNTEVLLNAEQGISNKTGFAVRYASQLGELINNSYNVTNKQVSVTTSRQQIGDVLRDQASYTGRDKTISILDGLLDQLDASKLGDYITFGYVMPTNDKPVAGAGIAQALLTTRTLNTTVFGLSTATARHAQEHTVNEKVARSDKTMQQALASNPEGTMWVDMGYGTSNARDTHDINGKSRDYSQSLGLARHFGADGKHGFALQLSNLSHRWTESYGGLEKKITTRGAGLEGAYTFNHGNYWLSAMLGVDFLKAKTNFGSDRANQYLLGLGVGKVFNFERFSLMPSLSLKHARLNGMDYNLNRYGADLVSADNVKTHETSATLGIDGLWKIDEKGKWTLNAGLKLREILNGKTRYTANYGGIKQGVSESYSGHRPNIALSIGTYYQITDNLNVYLNGVYENGRYRNKRAANVGLGWKF